MKSVRSEMRCQRKFRKKRGCLKPRIKRTRTLDRRHALVRSRIVREGSWVNARIDHAQPERKPAPKPDVRRMLRPLGPIAVFAASNFPLAIGVAGSDPISALAAGNPVVVKAHPSHPGTSEMLGEAIRSACEKSGMPAGIFSMLQGAGHAVGLALVRHHLTKAVAFTGSLKGGRALFDAALARPEPIPCFCEMGSTNPIFLLPGALEKRSAEIAKAFAVALTMGVGQFCTNPGVAFAVAGPQLDSFIEQFAAQAAQVPAGTMLNPGICDAYWSGVERLRRIPGVKCAGGAERDAKSIRGSAQVFVTDAETFLSRPELSEEVFGPATIIGACASAAQLSEVAAQLPGQLTTALHGTPEDLATFSGLAEILAERAGRVIVNGFGTGVEVCASKHHGGPYPATTDASATSLGTAAILRFARPVCYQDFPQALMPAELRDDNPRKIMRLVDDKWTQSASS